MKTIIKDSLIEPYEIYIDELNHTVGIPNFNEKTQTTHLLGSKHFHSLEGCLRHIAKKIIVEKEQKLTIKQYITEYGNLLEQFKQLFNGI